MANIFSIRLPGRQSLVLLSLAGASASVLAATATIQDSAGKVTTCTYSALTADANGNINLTCQAATTTGATTSSITANGTIPAQNLTQNVAMTALNLANYLNIALATGASVTYTLSGAPPGIAISPSTGVISGTPTAAGTSTATWSATAGTSTASGSITFNVAAASTNTSTTTTPPTSGCGTMPSNFVLLHSGDSAYNGTWKNQSGYGYIAQLPAGAGVALEVTATKSMYPNGFIVTDGTGGTKKYVVSACPGSNTPVANIGCTQNNNAVAWTGTGDSSTCIAPAPTGAEKYYVNITNTGGGAVGVQYTNYAF